MTKFLFTFLLAIAFSSMAVAQTFSYIPKSNLSSARCGFTTVSLNGKMYIFGGSDLNVLTTVQEYDTATDTWTNKQPMPYTLTEAFVGVVNGKIYVVGGWDGNWAVNYVQEFDPAANTWTQKAPMPTQRALLSGAVIGGKIYVTCGWHGEYKILEVYDPATNTWATKTDAPYGMLQDNSGAGLGNNLYIMGGKNYASSLYYDYNMQYNTLTDTWAVKAAMPGKRFAGCAVAFQGKVHYFGGKNGNAADSAKNTHYIYDEATNTWATGLPLPKRLTHLSATVIGDKIYICGGVDSSGALVNNVWEYGIPADTSTGGDTSNNIHAIAMQNVVELKAFPNPAINRVQVKLGNIAANAQLVLCNMAGIVLKTIAVKQQEIAIDLTAVPAGIYMLRYSDDREAGYLKLTKL
jgi:N-acetylneuraminic acid mutarotase